MLLSQEVTAGRLIAITLLAMWGGLRLPESVHRALNADESEWQRAPKSAAQPAL